MSQAQATLIALLALVMFAAGCDGRLLVAGNIVLATVPCVLLWMTVNLQKAK